MVKDGKGLPHAMSKGCRREWLRQDVLSEPVGDLWSMNLGDHGPQEIVKSKPV